MKFLKNHIFLMLLMIWQSISTASVPSLSDRAFRLNQLSSTLEKIGLAIQKKDITSLEELTRVVEKTLASSRWSNLREGLIYLTQEGSDVFKTRPQEATFSLEAWYKQYSDPRYVLAAYNPDKKPSHVNYQEDTLDSKQFISALEKFVALQHAQLSKNGLTLVQDLPLGKEFVYAEAHTIPVGSVAYVWGDLHGDIASFIKSLQYLKGKNLIDDSLRLVQRNKPVYFIFCGDYVDRGPYSALVLMIIIQLKLQNPAHVILTGRGNHELTRLNASFGFQKELKERFGANTQAVELALHRFYNSLPAVQYVGIGGNYIHFSHGGLEFYDVVDLLQSAKAGHALEEIKTIDRQSYYTKLHLSEADQKQALTSDAQTRVAKKIVANVKPADNISNNCGFMWGNFQPERGKTTTWDTRRTGFIFGSILIEALLNAPSVLSQGAVSTIGVVRGHQHDPDTMLPFLQKSHGVYLLPYLENHGVFTVISTTLYTEPALLKIEFAGEDPAKWAVSSEYLDQSGSWKTQNFKESMQAESSAPMPDKPQKPSTSKELKEYTYEYAYINPNGLFDMDQKKVSLELDTYNDINTLKAAIISAPDQYTFANQSTKDMSNITNLADLKLALAQSTLAVLTKDAAEKLQQDLKPKQQRGKQEYTFADLLTWQFSLAQALIPESEHIAIQGAVALFGLKTADVNKLSPEKSWENISRAYRKLAFKYHPDRNADPEAITTLQKINKLYDAFGYWLGTKSEPESEE